MDMEAIINKLTSGDVYIETFRFTIPEGYELRQIAEKLSNEGLVDYDKFIETAENYDFDYKFLNDLPKGESRLEGYLFPSTYELKVGANEVQIINIMLNQFNKVFKEEYYSELENLGLSMDQLVTLASVVEREGKLKTELPIVSSVFHNRIDIGMKLQSCATVQYVLGERKTNLTNDDIAIDSPYNTYINEGLPPRPIASPGEEAIVAALFPVDSEFLFFVVSAEGDGSHVFSKTYDQHLKAKDNYKKSNN